MCITQPFIKSVEMTLYPHQNRAMTESNINTRVHKMSNSCVIVPVPIMEQTQAWRLQSGWESWVGTCRMLEGWLASYLLLSSGTLCGEWFD